MKLALACLTLLAASSAVGPAHAAFNPVHPRHADTRMSYCCLKSAEMGLGCCGVEADRNLAAYDRLRAADRVVASMGTCCATAVMSISRCCGQTAAALQADFGYRFARELPRVMALDQLPACCAAAVEAGRGCCGKDAPTLAATLDQEIAKATERLKKQEEGC
jgi:hypothetical protein